jgi:energy-coupling factor transport system permease protein
MSRRSTELDPRCWLLWAVAASLPPLLGRNPWPLLVALVSVVGVRLAWAGEMRGGSSWSIYIRLAIIFSAIGILFNVLTVRAGDRVLGAVPGWIPLLGGELTLNAVAFGILSGFALVVLVMVGATLGGLLDWSSLVRIMPDGLTSLTVAGSIAFAFIPQTTIAFHEIREAQAARGHRFRGARDLLPIIVPALGGGLERAMTLAEALESRGFGGIEQTQASRFGAIPHYAAAIGIGLIAVATYAVAVGRLGLAAVVTAAAAVLLLISRFMGDHPIIVKTAYRSHRWWWGDLVTTAGAVIAAVATITALELSPDALRFEPYPHLDLPAVSLPLMVGLLGLLAPAIAAPPVDRQARS